MQSQSEHVCPWCQIPTTKLSRCAGCKKVAYCSKECQKEAWPSHIFDCQLPPGQVINTAYRLYKACLRDEIPTHEETRRDYGFEKAARIMGGRSENMLCGLFRGLFIHLDVPPKAVHKWRQEGRLAQGIKDAFEAIPHSRGGYYPWFLQYQSVLENDIPDDELIIDYTSNTIRTTWAMTGGSPGDSLNVIQTKIMALSHPRQDCHVLYRIFATGAHPGPNQDAWIHFGFVSALNKVQERDLGIGYHALVRVCSFEEFCVAYESSSIPALFERYGLHCTPAFRDVMAHSPYMNKSVWDLKHYIDRLAETANASPPTDPIPSVTADYGYINCRDERDRKQLDTAYKRYFTRPGADPVELHQACIQGRLVAYLAPRGLWKPQWKKLYSRLLRNPYPLTDHVG